MSPNKLQSLKTELLKIMEALEPSGNPKHHAEIADKVIIKLGFKANLIDAKNHEARFILGLSCIAEANPSMKLDYPALLTDSLQFTPKQKDELYMGLKDILKPLLMLKLAKEGKKLDPKELDKRLNELVQRLTKQDNPKVDTPLVKLLMLVGFIKAAELLRKSTEKNKLKNNAPTLKNDSAELEKRIDQDFRMRYGGGGRIPGSFVSVVLAMVAGDQMGFQDLDHSGAKTFEGTHNAPTKGDTDHVGTRFSALINSLLDGTINSRDELEVAKAPRKNWPPTLTRGGKGGPGGG